MKKLKLLFSLSILFFALYSCNEQLEVQGLESLESKKPIIKDLPVVSDGMEIDYCGTPVVCPLVAGQNIDAGTVTVRNDDTYLYITVFSKAGFQDVDENVKIWAGTELPKKRPPAGHFPYKDKVTGLTSPEYKIKLSDIGWDGKCGENTQPLYIIVHADVLTLNDGGQTAFGGCIEAETKGAWWYYMDYKVQCCDEEEECLDAFAFKYLNPNHSNCLDYTDNETKNLVWSNNFNFRYLENRNYQFSLIANAEECIPQAKDGTITDSAAIVVGFINITMFSEGVGDGIKLYTTISYHITNTDYKLSNVNLYLNNVETPNNVNPLSGDYNYNVSSPEWNSTTTTFEKLPWPGAYNAWDTFLIPHVKVCKK